jgi:hypothetical protein
MGAGLQSDPDESAEHPTVHLHFNLPSIPGALHLRGDHQRDQQQETETPSE